MPGRERRRGAATRRPIEIALALGALVDHGVDFIVIGGFAVIAHGSQRLTKDLDIVVDPAAANCRRLVSALVALNAEYRLSSGRWTKVRRNAEPKWLKSKNHLFDTDAGGVDVFFSLEGVPTWKQARPRAVEVKAFGYEVLILDKDTLIRSKLVAGRDQDLADVTELTQAD